MGVSSPAFLHGETQGLVCAFFAALCKTHSLYACIGTRMRLRPGDIPDFPPLIAIEILSPADQLLAVRDKLEEYRAWGGRTRIPSAYRTRPQSLNAGMTTP